MPSNPSPIRRRGADAWRIAAYASLALPWFALAVRVSPRRTLRSPWMRGPLRQESPLKGRVATRRIAEIVESVAGRHPVAWGCLPKALATAAIARRCGHDAVVVLGVNRNGGELRAHAWVEEDGQPVLPQDLSGYARAWALEDLPGWAE